MKRLGILTVSLCAALAVLCSAAIARGWMLIDKLDEATRFGLDVCDGVPCFFGLKPGISSGSELRKLSKGDPSAHIDVNCEMLNFGSEFAHSVYVCPSQIDASRVGFIEIGSPRRSPLGLSLATVIRLYGVPCFIGTFTKNVVMPPASKWRRLIILDYPRMIVNAWVSNDRIEPRSEIFSIAMLDAKSQTTQCDPTFKPLGYLHESWHGFAHISKYLYRH
jgi:hypothetical protein